MKNKVTVRDIAREAGVSVATVSYVLNERTDQKISPETRKKVLQIANLLNYRPSHAAKSLATGRNNIIGIAYSAMPFSPSRNHEITIFANFLIEGLNRMKYDVLFVPIESSEDHLSVNYYIDAIIAIDLTHEQFRHLADRYLVPVIAVDMLINDNLFYQIYPDYPALIQQAGARFASDYYLVFDAFGNLEFQNFITDTVPTDRVILFSEKTASDLQQLESANFVVIGSYLALIVSAYINHKHMTVITSSEKEITLPSDITTIYNDIVKKANITINILLNALERNFDLKHDIKVSIYE